MAGVQAMHEAGVFDVVLVDEQPHYCINDMTTGMPVHRFAHMDPKDLKIQLEQNLAPSRSLSC